jgi:hypothetical protein
MLCSHCGKSDRLARSGPDHRRLFAIINAAHDSWPEQHRFQPSSAEHLRAWLLIQAGYCEATLIESEDYDLARAVQMAVRVAKALDAYGVLRIKGEQIEVVRPKSMRFDKMSQREFGPIRDAIEHIICAELGVTIEALSKAEAA